MPRLWATLPRDEQLAVLRAQTNVQLVEDPESDTEGKIEYGLLQGRAEATVW